MPIRTTCPGCRKSYSLNESFRGKMVRCKTCQKTFTVGDGEEEILDAVAAEEDDEPIEAVLAEPARPRVETRSSRRESLSREDDDEYEEESRPRRRRRQGQNSNAGVIIGVAIGGGVLLVIGAAVVAWLLLSQRSSAPSVVQGVPLAPNFVPPPNAPRNDPNPAPANPPPADQGGAQPAAPNPQPGGPAPGQPPPGADAPAGETVVTLSNARRSNGPGPRGGFSVDYKFAGGAPRFGGIHYRIVVKQAGGGISHGDIHGLLDQEGTLSFREFGGFGPGGPGGGGRSAEIYMERSNVPGPFGQWTKCSNSVTLN